MKNSLSSFHKDLNLVPLHLLSISPGSLFAHFHVDNSMFYLIFLSEEPEEPCASCPSSPTCILKTSQATSALCVIAQVIEPWDLFFSFD